jgi:hypothetical protein
MIVTIKKSHKKIEDNGRPKYIHYSLCSFHLSSETNDNNFLIFLIGFMVHFNGFGFEVRISNDHIIFLFVLIDQRSVESCSNRVLFNLWMVLVLVLVCAELAIGTCETGPWRGVCLAKGEVVQGGPGELGLEGGFGEPVVVGVERETSHDGLPFVVALSVALPAVHSPVLH